MKSFYWRPLLFSIVFAGGIWLGSELGGEYDVKTSGQEKLLDVIALINEEYVDEVEIDSLVEMVIPELLSNLDPHSAYIPARDYELANSDLQGQFSGVGVSYQVLGDTLCVIEVISGGPAEKAGLLPGDRIVKVDGKSVVGNIAEDDVPALLRGPKGTHVGLTVVRSTSKQPLEFDIERDDVSTESIDAAFMVEPGLGFVKVSRFARNTYSEFLQALNKLRLQGAKAFVIDLRFNTGGYVEPAVLMANEFLDRGEMIVSLRGRNDLDNEIIVSDGTGAFSDYPVAVLINEFTASASEIFSGAIQDNDRGWIIGRRSFGKGLVQKPIVLADSSEVRLTVQRYYTPSGRCIQKDYTPGDNGEYEADIINRFNNGESLSADSISLNTDLVYMTMGGRTVYGGGGIMPDIFVPDDTLRVNSYYRKASNKNLFMTFAYEYSDLNRDQLQNAKDVEELLEMLPPDYALLDGFVRYCVQHGVKAQWYYINTSAPLIVNQLKGLIARNILGLSAYYDVANRHDATVQEAIERVKQPVTETIDSNE